MTEAALLIAAAVLYLLGSAAYGAFLFLRLPVLALSGRAATVLAVVLHTVAIGVHCARTHQTPFTTPAETLSASAWAIALAYLALEVVLKPKPTALGAVALPAAFLCLFAGALLPTAVPHRAFACDAAAVLAPGQPAHPGDLVCLWPTGPRLRLRRPVPGPAPDAQA